MDLHYYRVHAHREGFGGSSNHALHFPNWWSDGLRNSLQLPKQKLSGEKNKANETISLQNEIEGKGLAGSCRLSTGCFTRRHAGEQTCRINWTALQVSCALSRPLKATWCQAKEPLHFHSSPAHCTPCNQIHKRLSS